MLGMLLTISGVYGLLAFTVAQRTKEMVRAWHSEPARARSSRLSRAD